MDRPSQLDIWMGADRVGLLDGTNSRNLRVVYDTEWVARRNSTPLSVSMPVAGQVHSGRRVSSYLWGLLPDNDRVLARWATAYQCSATDVFALIRAVGADVAGAARYLEPGTESAETGPASFAALTGDEVGELLLELKADTAAWHPRNRGRWSLAGAQAKIALAFDDTTSTWSIPSGALPTTHILKPGIAGLDDHHVNEHLCLRAAAAMGLRTASSSVQQFGSERALVVERYDRAMIGGVRRRVHQEDFCQALSIHPEHKYEIDGGPGVTDIAGLLSDIVVTRGGIANIDAFLRAVAFNWLVLGTDAHAKNYSLLLSGTQVRFAPLYDVASSAAYGHPRKLRLAQKVAGENRPVFIKRRHWERVAASTHIDADRLLSDIESMADRLPDALADAAVATELTASETKAASKMIDKLGPWSAQCRMSLSKYR